jgi:hypothetical protein
MPPKAAAKGAPAVAAPAPAPAADKSKAASAPSGAAAGMAPATDAWAILERDTPLDFFFFFFFFFFLLFFPLRLVGWGLSLSEIWPAAKAKPVKVDEIKQGGNVLDAILRPKMAAEGMLLRNRLFVLFALPVFLARIVRTGHPSSCICCLGP